MRKLLTSLADNSNPDSLANRYRRKRFEFFRSLAAELKPPFRILDIGGTGHFWKTMGFGTGSGVEIVLLNTYPEHSDLPGVRTEVGDGRDLSQYRDGEFDVVFSNSVIEHVGGFEDQQAMAREVMRVGRRYFVQTPNLYFPLEPHFLFPFFQFLPIPVRAALLQRFSLGWYPRCADRNEATQVAESVRLISARTLSDLFPGSHLYRERSFGMTKSLTAYGGWAHTG